VSSVSSVTRDASALNSVRGLLVELRDRNPFYRHKLASVSAPPMPASLADFAARFPFTTKSELVADQAAHPPYGTARSEPLPRFTRCHQTSGTTGAPLRWLDTPESWGAMTDDWVEVFRRAGLHSSDRVLMAFSFGPFLGFWLAFEASLRLGAMTIPGGGMSTALRARVLAENACTVLCCTPSYALHLAESLHTSHSAAAASSVRLIVVAGEPGGSLPTTRARLSAAWPNARIFDHHGMTEVGPVTHEDPDQPGNLIVLERSFYAEVVDPSSGVPVNPGESGELILTTLRRKACALLRYRTGDLVRGAYSPSGFTLFGGILGRVDDMIVIRGVNIYPSAIEEIIRAFPDIAEFRVTQDCRNALPELRIEIEADPATATHLANRFLSNLALRIPVTALAPGTLPRFDLKARRWIRLTE
jgi:phenylacetate-CoA ligase